MRKTSSSLFLLFISILLVSALVAGCSSGGSGSDSGSIIAGPTVTITTTPDTSPTTTQSPQPTTTQSPLPTTTSSPQPTVTVTVTPGPDAAIVLPTPYVNLGYGTASSGQLPVQNTGLGTLTVNSISLSGVNPGSFTINTATPFDVGPGATVPVDISFSGSTSQVYYAAVQVNSSDPASPTVNGQVSAVIGDIYVDGNSGDDGWDGTSPVFVSGTTGPKLTIQAGVDTAAATQVVVVLPATYTENVTIAKSLYLYGGFAYALDPINMVRGGGDTIMDGTANPGVGITVTADNVEISGFTVDNYSGTGIYLDTIDSGLICYNVTSNCGTSGVYADACINTDINYNLITDIGDDALNVRNAGTSDINIIGNHVQYCYGDDGIVVYSSTQNVNVEQNLIHHISQDGITAYGTNILIQDNEMYNCGSENGTIYIYGGYGGSNVQVNRNNIHDNGSTGITLYGADTVTITDNDITDNIGTNRHTTNTGILIHSSIAGTFTCSDNNITGNLGYGFYNDTGTSVTIENNWWGDASGPNPAGTGDPVGGPADYDPWLTTPAVH